MQERNTHSNTICLKLETSHLVLNKGKTKIVITIDSGNDRKFENLLVRHNLVDEITAYTSVETGLTTV